VNGEPLDPALIRAMNTIQHHRGPDDEGVELFKVSSGVHPTVGLGHRRLSIIDLSSAGHQPMPNEDNTLWIVHNGEIYNYIELRDELIQCGHTFRSHTDAEVIVHAYEEWGESCLNRFNGMWAFVVWDGRSQTLFCAKDRIGKKSFYYYYDNDRFIFASEIKAMLLHPRVQKKPNEQAIFNYLSTGYGYADISNETFFENIYRLEGGWCLRIKDRTLTKRKYWDIEPSCCAAPDDEKGLTERFYGLFEDAVRLRLRSDMDVGIALSGGLDSSAIACVARELTNKKLKTFSSCFEEEEYDERPFIRPVLEKTGFEHNFIFSGTDNLFETLKKIIWHQDEPSISMGIYVHWNVFEAAKKSNVKVVLAGQGGDETLAGYHKYYPYYFADLLKEGRVPSFLKELGAYANMHTRSRRDALCQTFHILAASAVPRWAKTAIAGSAGRVVPYLDRKFAGKFRKNVFTASKFRGILNNDLYNAFKMSPLPYLLRVDDKNGMAHSVESRSPFLDYRLVEFFFSIPSLYKIRDGFTKYLLRESMKGIMPEKNRLRTDKKGFPVPSKLWFRKELNEQVREVFNSDCFKKRGYFDTGCVLKMFEEHTSGKEDHTTNIWSILNLELWFRIFMDGEA